MSLYKKKLNKYTDQIWFPEDTLLSYKLKLLTEFAMQFLQRTINKKIIKKKQGYLSFYAMLHEN